MTRFTRPGKNDRSGAVRRTQAPPRRIKPVQGVGRHGWRGYCERCGQKHAACSCQDPGNQG